MLDRLQQHDLETSLAEGLLTKADRASMKSALELRAPFLDQEVMEFAASLPGTGTRPALTNQSFFETLCPALPAHGNSAPQKARAFCPFEQLVAGTVV